MRCVSADTATSAQGAPGACHGARPSPCPQRRRRCTPRAATGLLLATAAAAFAPATSKRVEGVATLSSRQARVVTKFCFDFNPACKENNKCPLPEGDPGRLTFHVYSARRVGASEGEENVGPTPKLYIALLDDEYFSFPEVSQVWGEAKCTDILNASKRSYRLDWNTVKTQAGETVSPGLVERLRPRWWYIAFVSCSDGDFQFSYDMHLENTRSGWEREFSMDEHGVYMITLMFLAMFGCLSAVHVSSMQSWRILSRTGSWTKLHPALLLVSACAAFSAAGQACWFLHYRQYSLRGEAAQHLAVLGRGNIVAAKTVMSLLLMLLAQGECVCSPDILWHQHHELVSGMVVFGVFQFALELWGDSTFQNTSTEYIYDTTPGIVLVAFDCLWFWMYISRSVKTFASETRLKPRVFYKKYGVIFCLWFAQLPMVACLARAFAAHVRFFYTAAFNGFVHTFIMAVLVHSFRPSVAVELYDLKDTEYEAVKNEEELDRMLGQIDDDFI